MRVVHIAENFGHFLEREVRVEKKVHGLSHAHLVLQIEKGQTGQLGDVRADGRLAAIKQRRELLERQLLAAMQIHVAQDLHGVHGVALFYDGLFPAESHKQHHQLHEQTDRADA